MKRWILAVIFLFLPVGGFFLTAQAAPREEDEKLFRQGIEAYNRFSDSYIEESIVLFEKAIELNPSFSPAYSALAEAYMQKYFRSHEPSKELIQKAADASEKALFTDARSATAHKAIASVYFAKGMVEEAMEELERAIDMVPDFARALLNLGTCWLELKDRKMAIDFFNEAINADNDDLAKGIAYYNIASLEAHEKKFDSALNGYQKAAQLVPAYYNIHYGLGVVYMNLKRDIDAVKAFEEALQLKPDYLPGHIGLASVHHRLGNKESALKAYEEALELDPESEEALKGLAALSGKKMGCFFIY